MLRRPPELYRTHRIAAAPGTHAALAAAITAGVPTDARVLDLGAYTGALLARLRDAGFTDLSAADLACHLTEEVAQFWACDFNTPFAATIGAGRFDAITACEVIEHLDDPRAFLRQCRHLLRPGGVLAFSTPNIGFFEGRLKFLLTGEVWGFSARQYRSQRHIAPIQAAHVPIMLAECGFAAAAVTTAASYATALRRVLTAPLWLPMRALLGPGVLGETLICVGIAADLADTGAIAGQAQWQGALAGAGADGRAVHGARPPEAG